MEFTRYGFDVYEPEVDQRGVDFLIRESKNQYYEIQVKSARGLKYFFFRKAKFRLSPHLYAVIVLFWEKKVPQLYLIPSTEWRKQNSLFRNREYGGRRKSKPEWGLNLSKRNMSLLEHFAFEKMVRSI